MLTREVLVEAAREGRLTNHAETYDFAYELDGTTLAAEDAILVESLFADYVFTFDNADVDSKAVDIPVRLTEGDAR